MSSDRFLRITEIFHSIQGESTWAGRPCTFVRLTGCPLRCVWCDTEYAFHGGRRMSIQEILAEVRRFACPLVEVTGGEPLAHPSAFDLVHALVEGGYTTLVETSGAFDVSKLDPRAHKIMDLKCPGSGESERNLWSNLDALGPLDEIKFVVANLEDFEWAIDTVKQRELDARVEEGSLGALLVSPVGNDLDNEETRSFLQGLAERVLNAGPLFRFQVQLHKVIWGEDARGV